jgi:hypothetical protein
MSNRSHYNGNAKLTSVPVRRPDAAEYHTVLIIKHARRLLELGGTIEDGLSAVMEAAHQEFHCRVLIEQPARLRMPGRKTA